MRWNRPGSRCARGTASRSIAAGETAATPAWASVLLLPGVHLHLYGKAEPRRGRKMGHLTVTAADAATARQVALQAASRLSLPGF